MSFSGTDLATVEAAPYAVDVIPENIPQAMRDRAQWLVWAHEWDAERGEWAKVPRRADGKGKAASTRPETWASFNTAMAAYQSGGYDGIGFALTGDDPFILVDLDKCQGEAWAVKIMDALDSYTEESPSGTGYHVIIDAKKPEGMGCKSKHFHNSAVEVYESGRYTTFTGQRLGQYPHDVQPRQDALESACAPLLKVAKAKTAPTPVVPAVQPSSTDDAALLDTMFRVCKGSQELFNGHGGDDASGNDQGLCNHLAFMTGSDPARMDRLFRQSGLMRGKWDEMRGQQTYGDLTISTAIRDTRQAFDWSRGQSTPQHATDGPAHPDPVDIFGNLEPPAFPADLLPDSIAAYAKDQAELMGVDAGTVGMAGITAAAACLDDRITIQPKRHDPTWTESARIWAAIMGDPSAKKSPGISKAMGPLFKINAAWRKDASEKMAAYEQRRKRWEKKAAKEDNPGPPPDLPHMQRLIYEDTTVESVSDLMAKHAPRGGLVFRDELTGWLSGMDVYKNGGSTDRAAWLEAYNGGHKAIDRVKRGSIFVENWSACILGGIQPDVIQQYAKATNHDGMLQRFILVEAGPAKMGADRPPDMQAKEAYSSMLEQIAATQAGASVVKLSSEAHDVKEALWEKINKAVRLHPNKYLAAAMGKWEGTYARLLLTFHAVQCAEQQQHPCSVQVSADTADRVARLVWDCLLPHAVRFYQQMDDTEDKARQVAGLLLGRGWERFSVKRDLDRNLRNSRRWKPWELDETMQRLESFGWIIPEVGKINERGLPAAYTVSPLVHERFKDEADKERERRQEITKLMGELGCG